MSSTIAPLTLPPLDNATLSVDVIGVTISILSFIFLVIITIFCSKYVLTKIFFKRAFYIEYKFQPLSLIKLIRYLQWMDLFMIFSQCYIMSRDIQSLYIWRDYCDAYNTDDYKPYCHLDKHCYIDDTKKIGGALKKNHCYPTSYSVNKLLFCIIIFNVGLNIIISVGRYSSTFPFNSRWCFRCWGSRTADIFADCGDSCFLLCLSKEYWRTYYLDKTFYSSTHFCVIAFICTRYILFWPFPIIFCLLFNGANTNYIEWYTVFPVFVLWILNEGVIKHIIYGKHPQYIEEEHILFILEQVFGKNIAKIIWVDFAADSEAETVELATLN